MLAGCRQIIASKGEKVEVSKMAQSCHLTGSKGISCCLSKLLLPSCEESFMGVYMEPYSGSHAVVPLIKDFR